MGESIDTLDYIINKYRVDPAVDLPIELPGGRKRGGLATLWRELGFKVGAEVGVESGKYAKSICMANNGVKLYLIDSWQAYPGYREHVDQAHLDVLHKDTINRTAPYSCEVIRAYSMDAVKNFKDGSLDFVYIDANHDYQHVTEDVTAWSKKVRPGGIVSGHDYTVSKVGETNDTIKAINDYTATQNIKPWFIWVGETTPSWMWVVQ